MTLDERKPISTGVIQNLILENRGKLSISGVNDVLSFDDQVVMGRNWIRITDSKRWKYKNKQTKYRHIRSNNRRRYIISSIQWQRTRKNKRKLDK